MEFNPENLHQKEVYKLLTGLIIPRPIAWVSTINEEGMANLAPFSYFNAVGDDPPHVMISISRSGHLNKDTLNNILNNKEFVVNMVTEDLAEKMNLTAHPLQPHESEFDFADIAIGNSKKVRPPLVANSPVSMECEMVHHYNLENHKNGGSTIIIGRVIYFHIKDDILLDHFHVDLTKYQPISRLSGANYAKLGELFTIKRPQ
ncbi:flavin reductase family protein [Flavobacterium sp.]|jgi:flavin reductase (DIM6/NTAB) family NADH-FMN oxidoreductase RutF|uniref:flavin reductase family protein n=1 Tax=Flavobacterium sp. TaxID=239 RepID=UPI0037C1A4BC